MDANRPTPKPDALKDATREELRGAVRTVSVEPNWQGMFRFAVQLVTDNMPKSKGQALVVEMLEYGQRLDADAKIQERQEKNDDVQV